MSTTLKRIEARRWVAHVDDERNLGNSIIVTLADGWEFIAERGCGVMGFDTLTEALQGTAKTQVQPLSTFPWTPPS